MRVIVSTVGTSLLRSFGNPSATFVELLAFLNDADPRKVSAETNALSRLLREGDRLIFLHSDTPDGKLCAEVLGKHYERKGYETVVEVIPHLSYREKYFRSQGLRSLVGKLVDIIRGERKTWGEGAEILINATGGFKAESAYATLVGLLFNVPVYYIHEVFQEIVKMPAVPVDWDYHVVAEYEDLFRFVAGDLHTKHELKKVFPTIPDVVASLFEEEENYVMLSPAGEVVFQAYEEKLRLASSTPVFLSREAWRWWERADATLKKKMGDILRKLKLPEIRRNADALKRDLPCFVYPRGRQDARVLFCEREGRLYICAFARHGDKSYETILQRKMRCRGSEEFVPLAEL